MNKEELKKYNNAFKNARELLDNHINFFDVFPDFLINIIKNKNPDFYDDLMNKEYDEIIRKHNIKEIITLYLDELDVFKNKVKKYCEYYQVNYCLEVLQKVMFAKDIIGFINDEKYNEEVTSFLKNI